LVFIESAYATSYKSLIVTLDVSPSYRFRDIDAFCSHPTLVWRP